MEEVAIKANLINKSFRVPHEKHNSLKDKAVHVFGPRNYTTFKALKDINFEVKKGEFFGIVGKNGSGKSTLLKILANIYQPTSGKIEINGTLAPFIELGVGFNPELTGRENVFLSGAILGLPKKKVEALYSKIVSYAEIEEFMDQKLKNYSSGMQVRLAFSIAIRAEADILLIDEVLAVGDAAFQEKCYETFYRLKREGKTIVFVTHDMSAVRDFCDRCIFIDEHRIKAQGKPDSVLEKYNDKIAENFDGQQAQVKMINNNKKQAKIMDARLSFVKKKHSIENDKVVIQIKVKFKERITSPIIGFHLKNAAGISVLVTNSKLENINFGVVESGKIIECTWEFDNIFTNGVYALSPAVANEYGTVFYDSISDFSKSQITGKQVMDGLSDPARKLKWRSI